MAQSQYVDYIPGKDLFTAGKTPVLHLNVGTDKAHSVSGMINLDISAPRAEHNDLVFAVARVSKKGGLPVLALCNRAAYKVALAEYAANAAAAASGAAAAGAGAGKQSERFVPPEVRFVLPPALIESCALGYIGNMQLVPSKYGDTRDPGAARKTVNLSTASWTPSMYEQQMAQPDEVVEGIVLREHAPDLAKALINLIRFELWVLHATIAEYYAVSPDNDFSKTHAATIEGWARSVMTSINPDGPEPTAGAVRTAMWWLPEHLIPSPSEALELSKATRTMFAAPACVVKRGRLVIDGITPVHHLYIRGLVAELSSKTTGTQSKTKYHGTVMPPNTITTVPSLMLARRLFQEAYVESDQVASAGRVATTIATEIAAARAGIAKRRFTTEDVETMVRDSRILLDYLAKHKVFRFDHTECWDPVRSESGGFDLERASPPKPRSVAVVSFTFDISTMGGIYMHLCPRDVIKLHRADRINPACNGGATRRAVAGAPVFVRRVADADSKAMESIPLDDDAPPVDDDAAASISCISYDEIPDEALLGIVRAREHGKSEIPHAKRARFDTGAIMSDGADGGSE